MKDNTIRKLFESPRRDLVVPEDQEWHVDQRDERFSGMLHRVRVCTYEDLQTLHFIPVRLRETDVREAMAHDDGEALAAARSHLQTGSMVCSCGMGAGVAHASGPVAYRRSLRTTYNAIRKFYNPALARVYSEAMGTKEAWDSLAVAIVAGWVKKVPPSLTLASAPPPPKLIHPLLVMFGKEIEINKNATLYTGPVNYLNAIALKIHVGGKMKIQSSGIKIWCKSAQGNLP
jgi:hypothetical protein